MKTWAKIRFRKEGTHYFEDAEGDEEFLKYSHRHMFHVTAKAEQFHDDRDIEFIEMKRFLKDEWDGGDFDNQSCEMIAKDIVELLQDKYGENRDYEVEVSEDGENGALVEC